MRPKAEQVHRKNTVARKMSLIRKLIEPIDHSWSTLKLIERLKQRVAATPQRTILTESDRGKWVLLPRCFLVVLECDHRLVKVATESVDKLLTLHHYGVAHRDDVFVRNFGFQSDASALPGQQIKVATHFAIACLRVLCAFPSWNVVLGIELEGFFIGTVTGM